MRKRPMHNNGGGFGGQHNQHRKPRYPQQGSGGGNHSHNRPRKNYSAIREKYLAQARDAMASGDRVLAENYLQHADHCYRMMMEENANRPRPQVQAQPGEDGAAAQPAQDAVQESGVPENTTALPAFLTANYEPEQKQGNEQPAAQQWEE